MGTKPTAEPHRRRGRPLRLAFDHGPVFSPRIDSTSRLAWLLTVLRLHHPDPKLNGRTNFAHALTATGVTADPTRMSRWESGTHPLTDRILNGYQEVLGLQPGHLTALANRIRSSLDPAASTPLEHSADDQASLDELFERLEKRTHTGQDWVRLVHRAVERNDLYLPTRVWQHLVPLLVRERSFSADPDQLSREVAASALARSDRYWRFVAESVGKIVTTPGLQFLEPSVMVLAEVDQPQVSQLLSKMMRGQRGTLRTAAFRAMSLRALRGQLGEPDLAEVSNVILATLSTGSGNWIPSSRMDLVAALPERHQQFILDQIRDQGRRNEMQSIISTGQLIPPTRGRKIAAQICRPIAEQEIGQIGIESDPMLERLTKEALFHVHRERRHYAGLLLQTSPYRDDLSRALLDNVNADDVLTHGRILGALATIGIGTDMQETLLDWGTRHPSAWIRSHALTALQRLDPECLRDAEQQLLGTALLDSDPDVRLAATNLIGRAHSQFLTQVAQGKDPHAAAAADWWLARIADGRRRPVI